MQATEYFEQTVGWARAHERHLSALSLAGGFAFDSYAFGRIDRPLTQLVFIIYLLVAGSSIAVLHALESRPEGQKPLGRTRTILISVAQFALGCLLSGFCVFYIRSASVTSSWPFLLFMAGIFIGNEYMRRYHVRLVFSALLFFFTLYSYAILLVPVVMARIGTIPFLISGVLAVTVFFLYMRVIAILGHDRYRAARKRIAIGMVTVTALINIFYFAKIFPPLPLVLSDAGVYHDVQRAARGYRVASETSRRVGVHCSAPFRLSTFNRMASSIFTAPFSRLSGSPPILCIVGNGATRETAIGDRSKRCVSPSMAAARTGFGTYSLKRAPKPGQWRVNIVTADGRAIGRVRFSVETQAVPPAVSEKTLK